MKFKFRQLIFFLFFSPGGSFGQWLQLNTNSNSNFISVQAVNDSTIFLAGNDSIGNGIILKSSDAGLTWATSYSDTTHTSITALNFPDADTGYAGYGNLLIKTVDGGNSWYTLNETFINVAKGLFFIDGHTGYYAVSGGIYRTDDGGNSWLMTYPGFVSNTDGIYFFNKDSGVVGGWYDPRIGRTTDGGSTWQLVSSQYAIWSLHFASKYFGCAVSGNKILKSIDTGNSWQEQPTGFDSSIGFLSIYCTDSLTCYAVGSLGTIIKSVDGGTNWSAQNSGTLQTLTSIDCSDFHCYATGANGTILKTMDGEVGLEHPVIQKKNAIEIFPNPSSGFISIDNYLHCETTIFIYNSYGEIVTEFFLFENQAKVDLSGLHEGIYFVQAIVNGESFTQNILLVK